MVASGTAQTSIKFAAAYWMERFAAGRDVLICDWGGAFGTDCFFFKKALSVQFNYLVCEIPEIVTAAKKESSLDEIDFTARLDQRDIDILYSNGTMTNTDQPFFATVERTRPAFIVLNGVECTNGPTFYTWQIYRKFRRRCVYVSYNLSEICGRFESLGYEIVGLWDHGEARSGAFLDPRAQATYYGFAMKRVK